MNTQNKSMFEDFFIIIVIISIIYGIYSFFSKDTDEDKIKKNISVIEKNVSKEFNKTIIENISQEINETEVKSNIELKVEENLSKDIETIKIQKEENLSKQLETINIEEDSVENNATVVTIKEFQDNLLQDIIKSAEQRRLGHNFFKNNRGYVRARFTIAQKGTLSHLEYIDGDQYYLKYINSEINLVFPRVIPKNLLNEFPQNFELRIEY